MTLPISYHRVSHFSCLVSINALFWLEILNSESYNVFILQSYFLKRQHMTHVMSNQSSYEDFIPILNKLNMQKSCVSEAVTEIWCDMTELLGEEQKWSSEWLRGVNFRSFSTCLSRLSCDLKHLTVSWKTLSVTEGKGTEVWVAMVTPADSILITRVLVVPFRTVSVSVSVFITIEMLSM